MIPWLKMRASGPGSTNRAYPPAAPRPLLSDLQGGAAAQGSTKSDHRRVIVAIETSLRGPRPARTEARFFNLFRHPDRAQGRVPITR